jgi:hypothetical protein
MTHRRLTIAGVLAMISALLAIPWFVLTGITDGHAGPEIRTGQGVLLAGGTFLLFYLLTTLRRFLHERHTFGGADGAISLLIAVNVISAATGLFVLVVPQYESSLGIPGVVLVIVGGIAQITFGGKFLRLPDNLEGLRKPYGYLNIVTGVCLVTVVLLPLGVVASAVADVMLGTIFFQAARGSDQSSVKDDPD